jgi:hypothetical protein
VDNKFDSFIEKGDSCLFLQKYECALYNYGQAKSLKPDDPTIRQIFTSLIRSAFEAVEFYPDSIIKNAYKIRFSRKNGYAVEYNSGGEPIKIGQFENDSKEGEWMYADGRIEKFHAGKSQGIISPQSTVNEINKVQQQFRKLYIELIASEKMKN